MALIDLAKIQPWASPAVAFLSFVVSVISVRVAIIEARKKAKEAQARVEEGKKYTEALEAIINSSIYVSSLKGVEENTENAAAHLQAMAARAKEISEQATTQIKQSVSDLAEVAFSAREIPRHLASIAEQTEKVTRLVGSQIEASVAVLTKATEAAERVAKQLTRIGKVAFRAQRDSLRAHTELIEKKESDVGIKSAESNIH